MEEKSQKIYDVLTKFRAFIVTASPSCTVQLVGSNFEILFTDIQSELNYFKTLLAAKKFKCFSWMLAQ